MPILRSEKQVFEALARYPIIERVFALAAERAMPIYLVGGTVRDLLLGRDTHDLDFAVRGSGLALARHIADQLGGYFVSLDRERHTGRVLLTGTAPRPSPPVGPHAGHIPRYLDVASLRGEDLHADLAGRDFTLNAIAIARSDRGWRTQDPLGGCADLSQGILRVASPSSFKSDPVRALRAVRMQIQFSCTMEPETRSLLCSSVRLLTHVSAERLRDEWFKILQLANSARALQEMVRLDLLYEVAPMIAGNRALVSALETVRAVERLWELLNASTAPADSGPEQLFVERFQALKPHLQDRYSAHICDERGYLALLKCAALLHATHVSGDALAARWKLSTREASLLHTAIHHYMDVQALSAHPGPTRRTIYRFFKQTGEPGIDAAMLSLAHTMSHSIPGLDGDEWERATHSVAQILSAWFEHHETHITPAPLLSGRDVMRALDLQPGPQIGELLQQLVEEQATGAILTRQQALDFVQQSKRSGAHEEPTSER
jgi:tRNA nucleotidyltransferase/poly(A) polymerase